MRVESTQACRVRPVAMTSPDGTRVTR
jgi:hypothetical protein